MTAVELVDIHKTLGKTRALNGATVIVGHGVTGLLGPNGAGKTTLLRIAATVLAPDSGVVRIGGQRLDSYEQRRDVRRRLGYCPQEPGMHPSFTVFEFIDYVAILKEMHHRRARHDEVRRVADAVGLGEVLHRRIRRLSGGMRRRVAVAQSLLGHPDVLILDEPTAGLDPEQRMRFREMVSAAGEGSSVLLSTHQTEDVAALCQRVCVMTAGAIVFDGTPEALTALAAGKVWRSDHADPTAQVSWRSSDGRFRHVGGEAPVGADSIAPSIEDAYLLLTGAHSKLTAA